MTGWVKTDAQMQVLEYTRTGQAFVSFIGFSYSPSIQFKDFSAYANQTSIQVQSNPFKSMLPPDEMRTEQVPEEEFIMHMTL